MSLWWELSGPTPFTTFICNIQQSSLYLSCCNLHPLYLVFQVVLGPVWNQSIQLFSLYLISLCAFLSRALLWTLLGGATWVKWANEVCIWISLRRCPYLTWMQKKGDKNAQLKKKHDTHPSLLTSWKNSSKGEQSQILWRTRERSLGRSFVCCMFQWLLMPGSWN